MWSIVSVCEHGDEYLGSFLISRITVNFSRKFLYQDSHSDITSYDNRPVFKLQKVIHELYPLLD
jgi:hypothetical protein